VIEVSADAADHSAAGVGDQSSVTEVSADDPDRSATGVGDQTPVIEVSADDPDRSAAGVGDQTSEPECRNPRHLILNAESGLFESDDCDYDCDGESFVSGTTNTSSVIDLLPVRYMLYNVIFCIPDS